VPDNVRRVLSPGKVPQKTDRRSITLPIWEHERER
jgi:hypothetical protein